MRRLLVSGMVTLFATMSIAATTASCACAVDCSGTLVEVEVSAPDVQTVEVCADDTCSRQQLQIPATAAAPVRLIFGLSDLNAAASTYAVRAFDANTLEVTQTAVEADLRPQGRCSCPGSLVATLNEGGVVVAPK
ncbi:hypothetical protein [Rhabdothermincola salaria]|uniref:hypothetical protein n=1 Tax=Rhabdothermincola salaria TaxID=2903142 RepID=UPI001E522A23|nr:hypothetical protein [Rhabdothermincola salaria]MCD9624956.1 hypothetical protein [Rhabdothermincola salaria]